MIPNLLFIFFSVLGLIFIALVVVVAKQPKDFCIKRSIFILAHSSVVFAQVNDLRKWGAWSPWDKLDPNMKKVYEGKDLGIGASSTWVGNQQVGEGRSTITDSRPYESIQLMLQFFKPFKAVNVVDFIFKAEGDQTHVTWSMSGTNRFMGKAINLLMNCEKRVGGQFEKGLADLKVVAEKIKTV